MKWPWFKRKKKKYTFDEFSNILQAKLDELNFTKYHTMYSLRYKNYFSNSECSGDFCFVIINFHYNYIGFSNGLDPTKCWHSLSEYYLTHENLQYLLNLISEISINSKKCMVQAKLDDLEKDF